jgi:hypothetical protein
MFWTIREIIFQGADLIEEYAPSAASEKFRLALEMLHEKSLELASQALIIAPENVSLSEIELLPISKNCEIAAPHLDDEIFSFPFVVSTMESTSGGKVNVNEKIVTAFSAVCIFNMGLCLHLEATNEKCYSAMTLRKACKMYESAWACLQRLLRNPDYDEPEGTRFLLMAISTNISRCRYHLCELDASNQWLQCLREIVSFSATKEDDRFSEVLDFFLMESVVLMPCIAAGAA